MTVRSAFLLLLLQLLNTGHSQTIRLADSIANYAAYHPQIDGYDRSVKFLLRLKPYVSPKDEYYLNYRMYLAEAYYYYGEFDKALLEFESIKKQRYFGNSDMLCYALSHITRIQKLCGSIDSAIRNTQRMLNHCLTTSDFEGPGQIQGPNPEYYQQLADLYLQKKQYKKALQMCVSIPDNIRLFKEARIKSRMFYERKQHDSLFYYWGIYSQDPAGRDDIAFNHAMAKYFLKRGDTATAAGAFDRLKPILTEKDWAEWKNERTGQMPAGFFNCTYYRQLESDRNKVVRDKEIRCLDIR